jgi:hypothetical protein
MNGSGVKPADLIVNGVSYPLSRPGSAAWHQVVSRARRELAAAGCCVLPGFVPASAAPALRSEGAAIAPLAYFDVETVNAYNTSPDPLWPASHPGRISMRRGNAFVARDRIPAGAIIHQLYTSEPFQRFVASCFELPQLYELADPLSGLCLNVIRPGQEHPWHFDTNEFTVSMVTQQPRAGGVFEYCPNIRSAGQENFAAVHDVLTGHGGHRIHRLPLQPGDLQLFRGRYSLHRVSRVEGETERHSAIFAYSERPGVVGTVARTRQLFGRVLPEHLAAQGRGVRVDQLLD